MPKLFLRKRSTRVSEDADAEDGGFAAEAEPMAGHPRARDILPPANGSRAHGNASEAYYWLRSNYAYLKPRLTTRWPAWGEVADAMREQGITGGRGVPITYDGLRRMWPRVVRDVLNDASARARAGQQPWPPSLVAIHPAPAESRPAPPPARVAHQASQPPRPAPASSQPAGNEDGGVTISGGHLVRGRPLVTKRPDQYRDPDARSAEARRQQALSKAELDTSLAQLRAELEPPPRRRR